jgi:RNA polymerase sigma factor (sigma-70 family)
LPRETPGSIAGPLRNLFRSGTIGNLDDEALLRRFADRRDEVAFEALVCRHGPMVLRVCRAALSDEHNARDAYQATFLILARRAGSIRQGASIAPWLFGVARRVALRARADNLRRREHERRAAILRPEAVEAGPPGPLPEVFEEVDRLPERLRAPVVLCYLQGHTYESAASTLGCPPRTVHSRLRTARDRLRRRLERRDLAPGLAVLVGFTAGRAGAGEILLPAPASSLARLAAAVASGESAMAGTVPATTLALVRGGLNAMTLERFKVVAAIGLLLGGAVGLAPVLAGVGGGDGPGAEAIGSNSPSAGASDAGTVPTPRFAEAADAGRRSEGLSPRPPREVPRPWETVVRIKALVPGSIGFVTGTIIVGDPEGTIVLTCAHTFHLGRGWGDRDVAPKDYPHRIVAELFDGAPVSSQGRVRPTGEVFVAEPIDFDFDRDIALLRIRPGRELKAASLVPPDWEARAGMRMDSIGCSSGNDPSISGTTIIEPVIRGIGDDSDYRGLVCSGMLAPGRSGGGLFTEEGYLAGVANYNNTTPKSGLYATPGSVRRLLDRNGLRAVHEPRPSMIAFLAEWSEPCQEFDREIAKLLREGYRITATDIDKDPALVQRHRIDVVPALLVLDGRGRELARVQGYRTASEVARLYREATGAPAGPGGDRLGAIVRRPERPRDAVGGRGDASPAGGGDAERSASFDEAFRGLLAMLEAGPIRLVSEGEFEISILLDDPGDIERARSILIGMFALGQPVRVEPSAGRASEAPRALLPQSRP